MNTALKLVSIAAVAATFGACSTRTVTREIVREQPIVQAAPQPTVIERVTVVQPPPAPQEPMPPAPAAVGYSWVAGHYLWQDNRWVWQPGQWRAGTIRPLPTPMTESPSTPPGDPNSRWIPGHWTFVGSDWVWVRGRWM